MNAWLACQQKLLLKCLAVTSIIQTCRNRRCRDGLRCHAPFLRAAPFSQDSARDHHQKQKVGDMKHVPVVLDHVSAVRRELGRTHNDTSESFIMETSLFRCRADSAPNKTVTASFWPWLEPFSGKSLWDLLCCSRLARQQTTLAPKSPTTGAPRP